jgi:hypothetical protein
MARETRAQFIPPPPPQADAQALATWAKQLSATLPSWLNNMQQVLLETQQFLKDIYVDVPAGEVNKDANKQKGYQESPGIIQ